MRHFRSCLLVFGLASACFADATLEPANPKSNTKTRAILNYLGGLQSRTDKRLLSGQFVDFGNGANSGLMERIHEHTGHWPAILGVDYADFSTGGLTWKA